MDYIEALGAHHHQKIMAEQRNQMEQRIIDRQAAEIAALTAKLAESEKQLAEAQRDAEKYRVLREDEYFVVMDRMSESEFSHEELDAAVAARSAG